MIVSKDEARRILQGKKHEHRVPVKPGQDCPFTIGRDYAISTMADRDEAELYGFTSTVVAVPGKVRRRRQRVSREMCRIRLTGLREQALKDMTVLDARAEGFRTTSEYLQHLTDVRSITPDPDARFWVLAFRLVRQEDDQVRLLAVRSETGYTQDYRSALPDEPEAVDEVTAERFAREAFERDDAIRRSLPIEVRLSLARDEAQRRGIDISTHVRVVEDRLDRIERTIRPRTEEAA